MPLAVDATAAGPTANAYVTVAAAETYAEYRVGSAARAFLGLPPDDKVRAIVTAARDIDTLYGDFLGTKGTAEQALEWPRSGTDYASLPGNLVQANIELAISYAEELKPGTSGDPLSPSQSDALLKRKETGPLVKEWFEPRTIEATAFERFPPFVQRLLSSLIYVPTTGWGSAIVTRGS
jgi:hypothetical protein